MKRKHVSGTLTFWLPVESEELISLSITQSDLQGESAGTFGSWIKCFLQLHQDGSNAVKLWTVYTLDFLPAVLLLFIWTRSDPSGHCYCLTLTGQTTVNKQGGGGHLQCSQGSSAEHKHVSAAAKQLRLYVLRTVYTDSVQRQCVYLTSTCPIETCKSLCR